MANEVTVTADVNGTLISWTNGYFSSPDRKLLNEVKKIASLGDHSHEDEYGIEPIALVRYGEEIMPGTDSVLGAAAAMKTVNPGRTIFPAYDSVALTEYFEDVQDIEQEESYVVANAELIEQDAGTSEPQDEPQA